MTTRRPTPWLLLAASLLGLSGCADFASYRRADAERNQLAVALCERALGRASLALCDATGACTCLGNGWDGATAPMARIHIEAGAPLPGDTLVASRR